MNTNYDENIENTVVASSSSSDSWGSLLKQAAGQAIAFFGIGFCLAEGKAAANGVNSLFKKKPTPPTPPTNPQA